MEGKRIKQLSDVVVDCPTPTSGGWGGFSERGSAWEFVCVCLFACAIAALCFAFGASDKVKANALVAKAPIASVQRQYVTKNIEDVRIGERTLGVNPQGRAASELDESIFRTVPHCGYSLCLTQADGTRCDIELLRPADWLDYADARLCRRSDGAVVDEADLVANRMAFGDLADSDDYDLEVRLDLPEMGVVGWALLTEIDDEVEIADGSGNIVTGTFAHVADNVLDLVVEGQDEPIGCTSNHPFWSVDRQEFTPAGELRQGERLLLFSGDTKRVAQKLPRPGPQVVYNLEVFGEHAYHVATLGVLVHNSCEPSTYYRTMTKQDYDTLMDKGILRASNNETFISPSLEYATENYNGYTVEFSIQQSVMSDLERIGRYSPRLKKDKLALGVSVEEIHKGWKPYYAYFKKEGGNVNIGLGNGVALDIFNQGIAEGKISYKLAPSKGKAGL